MEPYQLLECKRLILGNIDAGRLGLLDEALEHIARIDTKRYKRVRLCFEFDFDDRGIPKSALEVRVRRPWE